MRNVHGWYLPPKDGYFERFVQGPPKKKNGFQREHLEEAFKHVRAWNVAVDVGAHVGFWSRDMAERFGRVYCIEPAEDCFECLRRNLADYGNVHLIHAGAGDVPGWCTVQDDAKRIGNTGARFILPGLGKTPVITVDSLKLEQCDLLKIDVEGYELRVLEGAARTIAECLPVIIMECDKKFSKQRYGWEDDAAEKFLTGPSGGYKRVAHMRPDKVFIPAHL